MSRDCPGDVDHQPVEKDRTDGPGNQKTSLSASLSEASSPKTA